MILFTAGLYLFRKTAIVQRIPVVSFIPSLMDWADRKFGLRRELP
jgi:hypothetical protein